MRIPFVTSLYVLSLREFSTVTEPFSPTEANASAISLPISLSLFALIVATYPMFLSTFRLILSSCRKTSCEAFLTPLITSVILIPSLTLLRALWINSCAITMDVVVPSPAVEAVLSAACLIIDTARFSVGSISVILFATVTPSFVTVNPPT